MSGHAVVETLAGEAVASAIPDLARLRIAVFRDFPYLYDGDLDYERKYLQKFAHLPESTLVVARDGAAIVGASTALPMVKAGEDVIAPFRAQRLDPAQYYYFGESVLIQAYRGQGIGTAIVAALIQEADDRDYEAIFLNSQVHANPLYESFGFKPLGAAQTIHGIPHQAMIRRNPALKRQQD